MSTNKSRIWWLAGTAWALVLLALGIWSAHNSPPTVREQSDLTSAKKTIETVVAEATSTLREKVPGAQIDDGGYTENTCRITPMRDGTTSIRALTVTKINGEEAAVLTALRDRWPGTSVQQGEGLLYDAGNFVLVRGKVTEPGTLSLELLTGCRPS